MPCRFVAVFCETKAIEWGDLSSALIPGLLNDYIKMSDQYYKKIILTEKSVICRFTFFYTKRFPLRSVGVM